jgi:hypothetical protein
VPKPLTAAVVHRYMTVTFPPLVIHLHSYPLGPQTIGGQANLFEIPPDATTLGGPTAAWVNINDPADRPSGYFDSTDNHYPPFSHTDAVPRRSGMCTLLLEMFDSAGAFVACGNNGVGGPFVFVLPDLMTPDQYTSVLGPNNITADGRLQFRVLIDNNDTFASIDSVTVNGIGGDACGIRHYTSMSDDVAIAFRATHPNDYLTWGLGVSLGFYGGVASEGGSSSSPPAPQNPFIRTVGQLLGASGCTNGAFAVNLNTDATATDGYGNQDQYDRSASVAFALLNP